METNIRADVGNNTRDSIRYIVKYALATIAVALAAWIVGPSAYLACKDIVVEKRLIRDLRGARELGVRGNRAILGGDDSQVKFAVIVLARYPHITSVDIYGRDITDDAMSALASMAAIENLSIKNAPISNDGLALLCSIKGLKQLSLSNCMEITDDGIRHLTCLRELRVLFVGDGTQVTKSAVEGLRAENKNLVIFGL